MARADASPPAGAYSIAPANGGTASKCACSVRYAPISQSGFGPACCRRNSFIMKRSPYISEVLLCSPELRWMASLVSAPRMAANSGARRSAHRPIFGGRLAAPFDERQKRRTRALVARRVIEAARAFRGERGGDNQVRSRLLHALRIRAENQRQRHKIRLHGPGFEPHFHQRQDRAGIRQNRPVVNPRAADAPRLRAEPPLLRQEFRQQHGLDAVSSRTLQNSLPGISRDGRRSHARGAPCRFRLPVQFQPEKPVRSQRQPVRLLADRRKIHVAQHLHGRRALQFRQIQIHWLREAR